MGWGLIINNVPLYRTNKEELSGLRDELNAYLSYDKERLMMLASASPDQSKEDWINCLQNDVDELIENYAENYYKLILVDHAINNEEDVEKF